MSDLPNAISVDDHVVEPPDLFERHLPEKYKDLAPRLVKKPDGTDVWVYEDSEIPNIGLNAVAGRPPEEYNIEPPARPRDEGTVPRPLTGLDAFGTSETDLVWSQVLRKYPGIQFALSEGSIGWLPYWLERLDYVYQQHRFWTSQDFGDQLPSQVARDHLTFCYISDESGIEARHRIGIDNITWECDYPHSDSTWPHSPEAVMKQMAGVPDDEINKLTHLNAMRIFRYDPFSLRPREKSTVGALRAEVPD